MEHVHRQSSLFTAKDLQPPDGKIIGDSHQFLGVTSAVTNFLCSSQRHNSLTPSQIAPPYPTKQPLLIVHHMSKPIFLEEFQPRRLAAYVSTHTKESRLLQSWSAVA
jgi:hypothetical protein